MGFMPHSYQVQDMPVEELIENIKTESYTGKPIDLDLENAGIEMLFSRLETISGLSFELSTNIPAQILAKKTYHFQQVPWDRILALVLKEFSLEAVPIDGGMYVRPKENDMVQIIKEDQLSIPRPSRIPLFWVILTVLALASGTTVFFLYKKRPKSERTSSGGFVIDQDKADEIIKKLTYLFEVEKIFRDEDISVQSLSEKLSIPSYQLSWIINKKMRASFSGLVNSYRIDEVKKRLTSPQDADKTILDIAFDAGFSTKTSFNRVFKRITGMTPSQYRNRHKVPF
jgi:AraC-like DNA-binding protein